MGQYKTLVQMPVLKKYSGYLIQVLWATGEQVLNTSTGYYYEPNKKTMTQEAITNACKPNTTYNLQNGFNRDLLQMLAEVT
jgi:hypothetical protein